MLNLFRNEHEGRPRALWRLLLQFVLYVVGTAFLANIMFTAFALFGETSLGGGAVERLAASPTFLAANAVASLVATLGSVWLAGRLLDRRPFSEFGLHPKDRDWWLDLGFGLFLGALLMTGIFFVELLFGWIRVTGTFETVGTAEAPFFPAILAPAVLFLCVGFYEELFSRGYQLQNMAEGLNFPTLGSKGAVLVAWVISSSLFGLLHLANPNATAISTVNIAVAGLLLGTGYILTGRLAIPIGLHITWNFFQGNVFGFPVSGLEPLGATFISIEQGGPSLWTGSIFGPEAGLLEIVTAVTGALLILLWVRVRSGNATPQTSIAEPPSSGAERIKALNTG
ncbi:MAG: CPBP family intramembrane metalloprotease [Rubrobacter sp.]|nr:CPBP family intramembrane metalloprotease [Rubrobacter sp.]